MTLKVSVYKRHTLITFFIFFDTYNSASICLVAFFSLTCWLHEDRDLGFAVQCYIPRFHNNAKYKNSPSQITEVYRGLPNNFVND